LVAIREEFAEVLGDRALATVLVKNPRPSVNQLMGALGVSQPTASSYLRKAEELGVAKSLGQSGKGRKERWEITRVWQAIQAS
jgi:predicted HTH transcriptional regulator